jgi:ribosome-associated protein
MAKRNAVTGSARSARTTRPRGPAKAATSRSAPAAPAAKPVAAKTAPKAGPKRRDKLPKAVTGAVHAALDKKAEDVVVLDLRKAAGFTDFFVICTGGNPRQITAIADAVRETLKREFDERPTLSEGIDRSEWILLDYFNFVVHVFSRDCRSFYGLERLWGNAERHEFSDERGIASAKH